MGKSKNYKNTGAYLREVYDSLVENLHHCLAEEGYGEITPSLGLVFQYLAEDGSRITTLGFQAGMTKQSMSALVYQLEGSGYLKRKHDPYDARAVLFILTAKGEALKEKAQRINYRFEKKWLEALGGKRYQEFRTMLEELTVCNEKK